MAQRQDLPTQEVASELGADLCLVDRPGLAFAIESAIAAARAEICAFVDDDAEAHPDWIKRIADAFEDPDLGALGGRDNVDGDAESGADSLTVGRITRTGRIVGNHHLGKGGARRADTVKGANMAVRVAAARGFELSRFVQGEGAQYRNELVLSAEIRRRGYRVIYDPAIQVDHFPASRASGDERQLFSPERIARNVANELTALRIAEPWTTRAAYVVRAVSVGNRLHPGLVHAAVGMSRGQKGDLGRFTGVVRGLRNTPSKHALAAVLRTTHA